MQVLARRKNLEKVLIATALAVGIFLRMLFLSRFPAGLHSDEASAAYDSFSILTTLSDRNNIFLPVYLIAWGSGQSALLAYLMMPFIKIFDLNLFATRLPMAIISSISLFVFYRIIAHEVRDDAVAHEIRDNRCCEPCEQHVTHNAYDNNVGASYASPFAKILFATLFFVLNPWHIMKSRWGLDCNLFPDFVLFGIYFLYKHFKNEPLKENKNLILAFIMFSISAYSYASAYLGLALLCFFIYIYGLKNKILNVKQILITILVVLLITWPLILFVIINFFDLNPIELVFLTIPKLRVNRMADESLFGNGNILVSLAKNIFRSLKLYIFQDDNLYWNALRGTGIYYLFSFPVFVVGIIDKFSKKKQIVESKTNAARMGHSDFVEDIFFIWLISGLILNLFFKDININRANFVIIPFIYFIIKGFWKLFDIKYFTHISFAILILSFSIFAYKYIDGNLKKEKNILIEGINTYEYDCFTVGLEPVIKYVDKLDVNEINLWGTSPEPYIYVLYYLKEDPQKFYREHKIFNRNWAFNNVKSYGKWCFEIPNVLKEDRNVVYVFDPSLKRRIDTEKYDIIDFDNYIVVRYKY